MPQLAFYVVYVRYLISFFFIFLLLMLAGLFVRSYAYSQCFVFVHYFFVVAFGVSFHMYISVFGSHAFSFVLMNEKNAKSTTTQSIMPLCFKPSVSVSVRVCACTIDYLG